MVNQSRIDMGRGPLFFCKIYKKCFWMEGFS